MATPPFDFRAAAESAAKEYRTTIAAIMGPGRSRRVVVARQALMVACHDAGWTDVRIARQLAMDPSSVGYGIRRHYQRVV